MANWEKITAPTLILDIEKAKGNIQSMAQKANQLGLTFRPHFKTHQSAEIGKWFIELGIEKIAVSSVKMATYFADNGWVDILIAFPINIREINTINSLSKKINLGLLISSKKTAELLSHQIENKVDIWIEIDAGYGRSGFLDTEILPILSEIEQIQKFKNLNFKGLLCHTGHTYKARSNDEIISIHQEAILRLGKLKSSLYEAGIQNFEISLGDTPSCSIASDFDGIDEIRPGNFIFYDTMQTQIGSCESAQIAVALACPIVAIYPERQEIIVHGGGIHLSKDFIINQKGQKSYGSVVFFEGNAWTSPKEEDCVISISQEHGVLRLSAESFNKVKLGDLIGILPVHSCMTADLMKEYFAIGADRSDYFISMMPTIY